MSITVKQLTKEFDSRQGNVRALAEADFRVNEHEFVCIVGPSGCGKTTLLRLIAGLLNPTRGEVAFESEPRATQPRTAMVFQNQGLFPWMNVVDNAAFGLEMQGVEKKTRVEQAMAFIEKVGLSGFAHNYPHELSGGMRQRVALSRAFLADPEILLMDEPFGALDAQTRLVLQEELLRVWSEDKKMVVFVTHDIEEAILLSDRILVMTGRPGKIREEIKIPLGRPRDLTASDQPAVSEIKWHIWHMLEVEVRKGMELKA